MIMLNKVVEICLFSYPVLDLHGVLDASDVSFPLFLSYMLLPHIHAKVGQRSQCSGFLNLTLSLSP